MGEEEKGQGGCVHRLLRLGGGGGATISMRL